MKITRHAIERAKERLGLDKNALSRLVPTVLEKGVRQENLKGRVKKYLDSIFFKSGSYGNPVIYGENVFIFDGDTLITVWNIPKEVKNYKPYVKNEISQTRCRAKK